MTQNNVSFNTNLTGNTDVWANIPSDLVKAHMFSSYHRKQLEKDKKCGCFYCLTIFDPKEIVDWCKEKNGEEVTAVCPYCGIDAIIGEHSGYKINKGFLTKMRNAWF